MSSRNRTDQYRRGGGGGGGQSPGGGGGEGAGGGQRLGGGGGESRAHTGLRQEQHMSLCPLCGWDLIEAYVKSRSDDNAASLIVSCPVHGYAHRLLWVYVCMQRPINVTSSSRTDQCRRDGGGGDGGGQRPQHPESTVPDSVDRNNSHRSVV